MPKLNAQQAQAIASIDSWATPLPSPSGVPRGDAPGVPSWGHADLLPLSDVLARYTDDQIGLAEVVLARRCLADWRARHSGSAGFFASVARSEARTGKLSRGQARGVLNTVGGAIRGNRRRFRKSRDSRADRFRGAPCLVCGGPLNDDESTLRAVGPICWQRVLDACS